MDKEIRIYGVTDFQELKENSWSGAIARLDEIEENGKEEYSRCHRRGQRYGGHYRARERRAFPARGEYPGYLSDGALRHVQYDHDRGYLPVRLCAAVRQPDGAGQ